MAELVVVVSFSLHFISVASDNREHEQENRRRYRQDLELQIRADSRSTRNSNFFLQAVNCLCTSVGKINSSLSHTHTRVPHQQR